MQFTYGCTRWVILTDKYAIKIARFRPLWPFIRLFVGLRDKNIAKPLERYGSNIWISGVKYIIRVVFSGMLANRREHQLRHKQSKYDLVPTVCSILWLVNIQLRGEPATKVDVLDHCLWELMPSQREGMDILSAKQFCIIGGEILLADYGSPVLKEYLLAEQN